jgi:thiol-disulfide isomerase/thioredoxin
VVYLNGIRLPNSPFSTASPGFITSTLDSKRIALKDYWEQKGKKVLVLSFFATWCHPCKEDLRYLQKVQDQYAKIRLQILAVHTQDWSKENVVKEFMEKLVDKEGILKAKYLGYSEDIKRHFEEQLRNLLLNP